MEVKVTIWFGNDFQSGNRFHLIWIHISKMETVSIWFGYSFQLIWKLSLDWYPNQMETVSILEICFQIIWILVVIMDISCGYPLWISDHWEYVVWHDWFWMITWAALSIVYLFVISTVCQVGQYSIMHQNREHIDALICYFKCSLRSCSSFGQQTWEAELHFRSRKFLFDHPSDFRWRYHLWYWSGACHICQPVLAIDYRVARK